LIANYGNLFYRVSSFIEKYFGKVPRVGKGGKPEEELKAKFATGMDRIEKTVKKVHLRDALKEVMALSDALNAYFQAKEPWFAIKTNKKDAATTLVYAINYLNIVTQLLLPYIPASTNQALKALNVKKLKFDQLKASLDPKQFVIKPGHKIRSMVLFEKIEDEELEEVKKTLLTQEIKKPLGVL
jgi:methionyl-tRNA synthetase